MIFLLKFISSDEQHRLNCELNNIFYYCELNNYTNISKPLIFVEPLEQRSSINWMEIKGNNITTFPEEVFLYYKNVNQFFFIHTGLLDIFESNFENAFELEDLSLFNNKLTNLNSNIFKNLKKLKNLDFRYNLIEKLSSNAFHGLTNLTSIYLDNNKLKTVESGVFYNLCIETLNLSNNELINFDFKNMIVERLNMKKNFLNAIRINGNISDLNVDDNNLITVDIVTNSLIRFTFEHNPERMKIMFDTE